MSEKKAPDNVKDTSGNVKDTSGLVVTTPHEESFILTRQGQLVLRGFFWNSNRISGMHIPVNDSIAQSLTFSYTGILISKHSMKKTTDRERIQTGSSYIDDGLTYHFDDNGVLSHVHEYRNGIKDGRYTSYFENGMVECSGFYTNAKQSGTWRYFNKNGKLLKEEKFNR